MSDGDEPLVLLSGQNRIFRFIGYDRIAILEPAPEFAGSVKSSL